MELSENTFRKFMTVMEVLSFLFSNIALFYLLSVFFRYPSKYANLLIFLGGLLVSAVIIKTKWFISKLPSPDSEDKDGRPSIFKELLWIRVKTMDAILLMLRVLVFNALNDLFMILIIWTSFLGFLTLFVKIIHLAKPLSNLVGVLSVISILSGLFQFYIKYYRENVTNQIMTGLINHMKTISTEFSFRTFLKFLKENHEKLYQELFKNNETFKAILRFFTYQRSPTKVIEYVIVPFVPQNEAMFINLIESSVEKDSDLKELREAYKEFSKTKIEELKKYIDKLDLNELRKAILADMYLFDEIFAMMAKSMYELAPIKEEPVSYSDYLVSSIHELLFYLVEKN